MAGEIRARLTALLRAYAQLELGPEFDEAALSQLLHQRQEIIEQIEQLDREQEVLRQAIAESPELQELLQRIGELDRRLLERAVAHRDALHQALAKAAKGRQATRGYRLNLPHQPAFINKNI